ncbi:hypothetical protein KM043_015670 [Ampulex compressa]|nr:hypothetical protein KM043_015670 [Ampulex compressa]
MNSSNFRIARLKEVLQALDSSTTGSKKELLARLQDVDPSGKWMQSIPASAKEIEAQRGVFAGDVQSSANRIAHNVKEYTVPSERELMLGERQLLEREKKRKVRLLQREKEILRISPSSTDSQPKASGKAVSDLLSDFTGSDGSFKNWKRQVKSLCSTYNLDDNESRILIAQN